MFLEDVLDNKTVYMPKWVNQFRTEVHAHMIVNGERRIIGCVFVGTAHSCNRYIIAKEATVPPVRPSVAEAELDNLFKRALEQAAGQ
jgi:hypothetical protein